MIKAQIRIPEELFRDLSSLASQREWSLAETFRRGAELLLQVYSEPPTEKATTFWTPPTSDEVGWKGLSADKLSSGVYK